MKITIHLEYHLEIEKPEIEKLFRHFQESIEAVGGECHATMLLCEKNDTNEIQNQQRDATV